MTVQSTLARTSYVISGAGPYTIPYYFLDDDDIIVIVTPAADPDNPITLTLSSDYTLLGAADENGGSLTLSSYTNGDTITIINEPPMDQLTQYPENGKFPAASHERALDKLTMIVKRAYDVVSRAIRLDDGYVDGIPQLPNPTANGIFAWDTLAENIEYVSPESIAQIVTAGVPIVELFNGGGSTFTLAYDAGVIGNLAVFVDGISLYPGTEFAYNTSTKTVTTIVPTAAGTDNVMIRYVGTSAAVAIPDPGDGSITPGKLSVGHPSWNTSGMLLVGTDVELFTSVFSDPIYQFIGYGNLGGQMDAYYFNNSGTSLSHRSFKSRGADKTLRASVITGDHLQVTSPYGDDGVNWVNGASISFIVDGAVAANNVPTCFKLDTNAAGSTSKYERFRVTSDGALLKYQPAPTSYTFGTTMSAAELIGGLLTASGAPYTLTVPSGANIDTEFPVNLGNDMSFDWTILNTGSGSLTLAGSTGHTVVGSTSVGAFSVSTWRTRKVSAGVFISYRLS